MRNVPAEDVINVIEKVKEIFKRNEPTVDESILFHEGLREESEMPGYGEPALKHIRQQASILGQLDHLKLLHDNTTYIEFGAGKGHLAHWTYRCLPECKNNSYVTVDRGSIKHKLEQPNLHTGEGDFHRFKIDIKDLYLGNIDCIKDKPRPIVALSKHLCGVATDLTFRCLVNTLSYPSSSLTEPLDNSSSVTEKEHKNKVPKLEDKSTNKSNVNGIVIALCCYHRCVWSDYCGQDFFTSQGLNEKDFQIINSLASWANCGFRYKDGSSESHEHGDVNNEAIPGKFGDLTNDDKEEIGYMSKRIIDVGRKKYLENHGFKVTFKKYVDKSVSLENVLLVAVSTES